jgi:hypothetical protein
LCHLSDEDRCPYFSPGLCGVRLSAPWQPITAGMGGRASSCANGSAIFEESPPPDPAFKTPLVHRLSYFKPPRTPAIMCASCNPEDQSGQNGQTSSSTNGDSHENFTAVKSRNNPQHRSSPYAPVGDFLSNVGRFKIIGTSPRDRSGASHLSAR